MGKSWANNVLIKERVRGRRSSEGHNQWGEDRVD